MNLGSWSGVKPFSQINDVIVEFNKIMNSIEASSEPTDYSFPSGLEGYGLTKSLEV